MKSIFLLIAVVAILAGGCASFLSGQKVATSFPTVSRMFSSTAPSISVREYGAACDGITDDSGPFQAAVNAASSLYSKQGVTQVTIPPNCLVQNTITIGSGVMLEGPGPVIMNNQTNGLFLFVNADFSGIENTTININKNAGGNNPNLFAVRWQTTPGDNIAHQNFIVRNNIIIHSDWGIYVQYYAADSQGNNVATGSLSQVAITDNIVTSPLPVPASNNDSTYSDYDGIHVAGKVSAVQILRNQVSNRGDAGIAITSEQAGATVFRLAGGIIQGNKITNCIVGIDDSGGSDYTIDNNNVRSTTPVLGSNPAFRSIRYPPGAPVTPHNITVTNNYFQNYFQYGTSGDFGAKVDDNGVSDPTAVTFTSNTFSSLYLRGNTISLSNNTFLPAARIRIDFDGPDGIPTQNVSLGSDNWLGNEYIDVANSANLILNVTIGPQTFNGTQTINNMQYLIFQN